MYRDKEHQGIKLPMKRSSTVCFIALITCSLTLSACGLSLPSINSSKSKNKTNATSANARQGTLQVDGSDEPYLPPPKDSFSTPRATTNYQSQSQDMIGDNSALFEDEIVDDEERFTRLEYAVQKFRNEFDEMKPALNRLIDIEKDIGELVIQLQKLTDPAPDTPLATLTTSTTEAAATSAPTPITEQPKTVTQTPSNSSALKDIRVSASSDKMRIVFDASSALSNTAYFDHQENLITVETTASNIPSHLLNKLKQSAVISDATVTAQNGKNILAIQLKKSGRSLIPFKTLKPSASNSDHRYYFDILF